MDHKETHNKALQPTAYRGIFLRSFAIFASENPAVRCRLSVALCAIRSVVVTYQSEVGRVAFEFVDDTVLVINPA